MPTLKNHIIGVVEAHKDISGVLNELEHNGFMAGLEEPHEFENLVHRCVECGQMVKFVKPLQRGDGICIACWMHEE